MKKSVAVSLTRLVYWSDSTLFICQRLPYSDQIHRAPADCAYLAIFLAFTNLHLWCKSLIQYKKVKDHKWNACCIFLQFVLTIWPEICMLHKFVNILKITLPEWYENDPKSENIWSSKHHEFTYLISDLEKVQHAVFLYFQV